MTRTLRQHITVSGTLTNPTISTNINLRFNPDEVIVREIFYAPADAEALVAGFIRSNLLVFDGISARIGLFYASRNDATNRLQLAINNPLSVYTLVDFTNNSEYQFSAVDQTGALINGLNGILTIHLEFVRYI
jgi:hypothetical protein